MLEAVRIPFLWGAEAALLVVLILFYLREKDPGGWGGGFLSGVGLSLGVTFVAAFFSQGEGYEAKLWIRKGHLFTVGGILLLSLLTLAGLESCQKGGNPGESGRPRADSQRLTLFESLRKGSDFGRKWGPRVLVFLGGLVLLPLEGLETVWRFQGWVDLQEDPGLHLWGGGGLLLVGLLAWGLVWTAGRIGMGRCFTLSGLLFSLAAIKVLWRPELLSSLVVIVARVLHDFVHWLIVLFLLPDHPYLRPFSWGLLGLLFRRETGLLVGLGLIFLVGARILWRVLASPWPELGWIKPGAKRRMIKAQLRRERQRQALPVALALFIFLFTGYRSYSSEGTLFEPMPQPLLDDHRGYAEIPLAQLSDGMIHKYAYAYKSKTARFIAIRRPDGRIAVTLDRCRICPPGRGYGQVEEGLFCLYCGTLIPTRAVGEAGGCNPAPVDFNRVGEKVRFSARKALTHWEER